MHLDVPRGTFVHFQKRLGRDPVCDYLRYESNEDILSEVPTTVSLKRRYSCLTKGHNFLLLLVS